MAFSQADIDELRAKMKAFAGIRATAIDNQSTTFDYEAAERLLARMEREVNGTTTRTRYAAVSKGV